MLDLTGVSLHTTDALPVLFLNAVPTRLCPSQFADVAYTPALLLDTPFTAATLGPDFEWACQSGFEGYFEDMCQWSEDGTDLVCVDRFFTLTEVQAHIVDELLTPDDPVQVRRWGSVPLAVRVGITLGLLSALALTDRPTALAGRDLLVHMTFARRLFLASR